MLLILGDFADLHHFRFAAVPQAEHTVGSDQRFAHSGMAAFYIGRAGIPQADVGGVSVSCSIVSAIDDAGHTQALAFADGEYFHPAAVSDQDCPAESFGREDGGCHANTELSSQSAAIADNQKKIGGQLKQLTGKIILSHRGLL
jgi:hypothetical protein